MNDIMAFIRTSAPWWALGLWCVASIVQRGNTYKGRKTPVWIKLLNLIPALTFLAIGAYDYNQGNAQSASSSIVLGLFIIIYSLYANKKEKDKLKEEKKN